MTHTPNENATRTLADDSGVPNGTIIGETKTANEPSVFKLAVPTSLMVDLSNLAYSKSTASTLLMPAVGTVSHGTVLPNAN